MQTIRVSREVGVVASGASSLFIGGVCFFFRLKIRVAESAKLTRGLCQKLPILGDVRIMAWAAIGDGRKKMEVAFGLARVVRIR